MNHILICIVLYYTYSCMLKTILKSFKKKKIVIIIEEISHYSRKMKFLYKKHDTHIKLLGHICPNINMKKKYLK